jgi:hypothetical protein
MWILLLSILVNGQIHQIEFVTESLSQCKELSSLEQVKYKDDSPVVKCIFVK